MPPPMNKSGHPPDVNALTGSREMIAENVLSGSREKTVMNVLMVTMATHVVNKFILFINAISYLVCCPDTF